MEFFDWTIEEFVCPYCGRVHDTAPDVNRCVYVCEEFIEDYGLSENELYLGDSCGVFFQV